MSNSKSWRPEWDDIFSSREWGKYPSEDVVRFVARNFYQSDSREAVRFLEVGSGTGANLWFLAKEGFNVTGIDGSEVGITQTKERFSAERLTGSFHVGDILFLPFDDASFDCVIDCACIMCNPYDESKKIIQDIHRVLKSNGRFFSKTMMTGTDSKSDGMELPGVRFTSEEDISDLYDLFDIDSVDKLMRTDKNQTISIPEWLISCTKK
ncbi:MAG: class I SAM-dependent methyltransferase [Candidatus Lindowbacteria bacterium]|nr:class I SAM-dependent methyltransferase [Candidatus Lindowbacteria bacterium]